MARKLYEFIAPAQAGLSLTESENGKDLFLAGLFIQGDVKNQNGRIYPKDEIKQATSTPQGKGLTWQELYTFIGLLPNFL